VEVDAREGTANLGYAIAHKHWGHGLGTGAAPAVVDYGFHVFGLAKIWARRSSTCCLRP
jgi:RimJ/RimL family protein N-acetyltransferase